MKSHNNNLNAKDYGTSGLDIQSALVDQARRYPGKDARPPFLLWNGIKVRTIDEFAVPKHGVVTARFLSVNNDAKQGFDLKPIDGWLRLEQGEQVPLLRTWRENLFEDIVKYPFVSKEGVLRFWNVYERKWPNGDITEEKWTGNAGFWVEEPAKGRRIYHCSHGLLTVPDFDSLVVEIMVES